MHYNEQNCECHTLTRQQVNYLIKRPNKHSGHFGLGQINMYDRNTGFQIKQLCTEGTQFYVRSTECTGFGIQRVIL